MKLRLLSLTLLLNSSLAAAQWSVGVAGIGSATPYKGLSSEVFVIPIVAYEGERLIWRGPSVQYKLTGLERGQASLQLSLDLAPNELEANESELLDGIEDRDFSFLAGLRYIYPTRIGEFSAVVQTDVSNKHDGQRGAFNFQRIVLNADDRSWLVTAGVQVEYLSDNYADYYFGVSNDEALRSDFDAFTVDAVWQAGVTLAGFYRFGEHWQLTAQSRWLSLASDVKDSPIVDDSSTIDGFIGVSYRF